MNRLARRLRRYAMERENNNDNNNNNNLPVAVLAVAVVPQGNDDNNDNNNNNTDNNNDNNFEQNADNETNNENNQIQNPVEGEWVPGNIAVAETVVGGEANGEGGGAEDEARAILDFEHGGDDADDDLIPQLDFAQLGGRTIASLSSYLYDMIREDYMCRSILTSRQKSCERVVEHCVQCSTEAFYIGHQGRIPLHEACLRGSCLHIVESLLTANAAGALLVDHRGNTPLHLLFIDFSTRSAANPQEIDLLVQKLLQIAPQHLAIAGNDEGSNPLHIACMTPETMVDPNSLIQLIQANPLCAAQLNSKNQSALRLHCQRSNASVEVAQILYQANPNALTILDGEDGWAPIHYAAANANFPLIQYLVEQNSSISASLRTTNGLTALHILCRQNPTTAQLPAIDLLLEADPSSIVQKDYSHQCTPLHLVCQGSRIVLPIVRRLLMANHTVASIPDAEHYLPLHHASAIGCDPGIIALLLEDYPQAASVLTRKQDSALSLACTCNRSVETVRLLIRANPEAMVKKNDYGFAPLHCVCRAYQPRMAIVEELLEACPSSIALKTHAGETPVHLACSNSGAFVGVIQLLTLAQNRETGLSSEDLLDASADLGQSKSTVNKIGNTPLHDACFRGSSFEHIETLAMGNPEWLNVCNNGGFTPLQILCKNARIDERIITTFSRMGGPETFSVADSSGNTPLHSAMRKDIDLGTAKCLIRAFPDALYAKTIYGDTPLHLACFRHADPEVVQEVALAGSSGTTSPSLVRNTASQTPIGIAMEEFRSLCRSNNTSFCCVNAQYQPEQKRAFKVLEALVKIVYYGSGHSDYKSLSLLHACVALHRKNIRLDPTFIRRAIRLYPEETRLVDSEGNTPLHYEAAIPIEKMALLDCSARCCNSQCHKRFSILRVLLEMHPEATQLQNKAGYFPLSLMIQNGRSWEDDVALAVRAFPPALHWKGLNDCILPRVLARVGNECGPSTLYWLLTSRPDMLDFL
mmetsp:Transcript_2427/g.5640  ORF Transcript_2427/g.5640 Transcript_2427/m.5640 type:complete len:983 (+) Transcript_2427:175-3123(+)